MNKIFPILVFFLIIFKVGISQEIDNPFKIKINVNDNHSDSTKLVTLKVCNYSLKTYFVSDYPPNSKYLNDSLCGFSLNYSNSYSDPLITPYIILELWKLSPFQCFKVEKIRESNYLKTAFVDFDYYSKSTINNLNIDLSKIKRKRKYSLTVEEYFNDLFFKADINSYLSYKINLQK